MGKKFVLALLVGTAATMGMSNPAAVYAATAKAALAPEDLFKLKGASDARISPDGSIVAYVRSTPDIMTDKEKREIWLIDVKTGVERVMITGAGAYYAPRWSPDGRSLAYAANEEGKQELRIASLSNGQSRTIAALSSLTPSIAWSPDGRTLAFAKFVADEPRQLGKALTKPEGARWAPPIVIIPDALNRIDGLGILPPGSGHVFTVPAEGGEAKRISADEFEIRSPKRQDATLAWTADGQYVLATGIGGPDRQRNVENSDIFRFAAFGGTSSALTTRYGPDVGAAASPDGKWIAYTSYEARRVGYQNAGLHVMASDGSSQRLISGNYDGTLQAPTWSADGRSIIVQTAQAGVTKLLQFELDGRYKVIASNVGGGGVDGQPYAAGESLSHLYSVARDGTLAFIDSSTQRPGDVVINAAGRERRLTHLNDALIAERRISETVALPVKSSVDGKPVGAWITTPPDFDRSKRYPLIVEIHGGPHGAYGPTFATDIALYAAAGYVVVTPNQRGSTSYGEQFATEIQGKFPDELNFQDVMDSVDAAIGAGYADPDRLYITGISGGGLLTAWAVGKTDRFKAAASQAPVINWASQVLTTDRYLDMARNWFGPQMPWDDPMGYWKRSPLSLVGNVKTPTMLVVGTNDKRTPPGEADQFYSALQIRGVPTALVYVPDASHGSLEAVQSHSAARVNAILGWFERFK